MTFIINMVAAATMIFAAPGWETITIYWDDISPEEQAGILRSSYVPANVREYYFRTEKPSDDEATFDVLKIVSNITPPWQKRALYIHIFDRILENADGALSEVMGEYCLRILKSDPEYVMYYLNEQSGTMQRFASAIAYEYYADSKPSADDFRKWLTDKFTGNPDLGPTIEEFCDEIDFHLLQNRE